jgi:hypothetical protein
VSANFVADSLQAEKGAESRVPGMKAYKNAATETRAKYFVREIRPSCRSSSAWSMLRIVVSMRIRGQMADAGQV